jgi:hypothetical protein
MKTTSFTIVYPGEKQLTLALSEDYADMPHVQLLEKIFAWFNHGSGRECDVFLSEKMRSLSVNDFVCINGLWWQCKPVGWARCAGAYMQEICDAVKAHPKFTEHGPWFALQEVMYQKEKLQ